MIGAGVQIVYTLTGPVMFLASVVGIVVATAYAYCDRCKYEPAAPQIALPLTCLAIWAACVALRLLLRIIARATMPDLYLPRIEG